MNCLNKCFVAADVRTPHDKIMPDIREYVFPSLPEDKICMLEKSSKWDKIVRLTERLEFVARLERIRKEVVCLTKSKDVDKGDHRERIYECRWLNEDFAGAHKDIESLEIFLLVAAIDEMLNDEKPGMMKRLRKAFCELVDDDVGKLWTDTYCVLELRRKEDGFGVEFRQKDFDDWFKMVDKDKKTMLMKALAQCRNQFVHAGCREFECDVPVGCRVYEESKEKKLWLLRRADGLQLISLLWRTVQSIAKNRFLRKYDANTKW